MTNYMWDLGFNWSETPDDGIYELENQFVKFEPNPAEVDSDTTVLNEGDQVGFNLFNLSSDGNTSSYVIENVMITFHANQNNQTTDSPFGGSSLMEPTPVVEPAGGSTGLGEPGQVYPVWSLGVQAVVNSGKYRFTPQVIVKGPDGVSRTYRSDPQMIVGSAS